MAFDQMVQFVGKEESWADMETELRGRGVCDIEYMCYVFQTVQQFVVYVKIETVFLNSQVKAINFFDIVIDFILFDAFDDLDCPPSSVTSVVQNRWLSNGFKETVNFHSNICWRI